MKPDRHRKACAKISGRRTNRSCFVGVQNVKACAFFFHWRSPVSCHLSLGSFFWWDARTSGVHGGGDAWGHPLFVQCAEASRQHAARQHAASWGPPAATAWRLGGTKKLRTFARKSGLFRLWSPHAFPQLLGPSPIEDPAGEGSTRGAIGRAASAMHYRPCRIGYRPPRIGHRPGRMSHRPSRIAHRPCRISNGPSAVPHQPSAVPHLPSAMGRPAWAIDRTASAITGTDSDRGASAVRASDACL